LKVEGGKVLSLFAFFKQTLSVPASQFIKEFVGNKQELYFS